MERGQHVPFGDDVLCGDDMRWHDRISSDATRRRSGQLRLEAASARPPPDTARLRLGFGCPPKCFTFRGTERGRFGFGLVHVCKHVFELFFTAVRIAKGGKADTDEVFETGNGDSQGAQGGAIFLEGEGRLRLT